MANSSKRIPLPPGLYEALVTRDLRESIEALPANWKHDIDELGPDAAAHVLAEHVRRLVFELMRGVPHDKRPDRQLQLANELVHWISDRVGTEAVDRGDEIPRPDVLRAVVSSEEARLGTGALPRPLMPLRQSDLVVNGPRDLRIGHQIQRELPSADRVDILVSFLKWSGLRVVLKPIQEFLLRRPQGLRVLTTTYMKATDADAIEQLQKLGAEVRISYDDRRTRLHAKAWLFHRESGFSTAVVGSSNLSHSAMLDGCEWNVRLTQVDNGPLLRKFEGTFSQYWEDEAFEPYDRQRFLQAVERRDVERDAIASVVTPRPYPHQQVVLDALESERAHGHTRNLVVAATGTGKTIVAALDYKRLRQENPAASLLFVAHRNQILEQSRAAYRAALGDGHFGEKYAGGERPVRGTHVFASIQSLQNRLEELEPTDYDVIVIDEFHHAAAPTYERLLSKMRPKVLLGLTATPERTDGKSVLTWFGGRIAAELRLWDALDQALLCPFQYFGVYDGTDLSNIDFRSGRYDVGTLEQLYTADHVRARAVLQATSEKVRQLSGPDGMRALGFCVSVRHAEFMASFFKSKNVPAAAVSFNTSETELQAVLQDLRLGRINVVFTVDKFNEGVDLPMVDTVLFLRPTESATVFLQQLGRGLRLHDGKDCLTVLDFIGNASKKFRFDQRFSSLVPGTRADVLGEVEAGFPRLPAGCDIQLDAEAQATVVQNIRASLRLGRKALAEDLASVGDVGLREFLKRTKLEVAELYRGGCSYTELLYRSGIRSGSVGQSPPFKAMERLLHVDDVGRLEQWRRWLGEDSPPRADISSGHMLMLFASMGYVREPVARMRALFDEFWGERDLRQEYVELLGLLADELRRPTHALGDLPFHIHATYSRDEVSAGLRLVGKKKGKLLRSQVGAMKHPESRSDILFVTLEKDEREFTPTTLYNDYPISRSLFHWESQSVTRADSETGRRYQGHTERGWRVLLFVRQRRRARGVTSPYLFLGPVRYHSHQSERPMQILWELERPMPPSFWSETKLAAG